MLRSILKRLFDFYLYSNLHISVCAVAMAMTTGMLLHVRIDPPVLGLIFFGTLFLYAFQRVIAFTNWKRETATAPERIRWMQENLAWLWIMVVVAIAGGIGCLFFFQKGFVRAATDLFHELIFPASFALLYAIPFFPYRGRWLRLRDFPGIKIFFVAGVWAMITVYFASNHTILPSWMPFWPDWFNPYRVSWFFETALIIFAITIPFDIRDMFTDRANLKTIPRIFGERNARILAVVLLFAAGIIQLITDLYFDSLGRLPHLRLHSAAIWIWIMITAFVVWKSGSRRHDYYFSFLIDGLMILLALLIFAAGCI